MIRRSMYAVGSRLNKLSRGRVARGAFPKLPVVCLQPAAALATYRTPQICSVRLNLAQSATGRAIGSLEPSTGTVEFQDELRSREPDTLGAQQAEPGNIHSSVDFPGRVEAIA